MKKPQISKFIEWQINENKGFSSQLSIEELCKIGKKVSFTKAFITKECKLNENYNFILEDEEILDALELQVAHYFVNSNDPIHEGFTDFAKSLFGDKVLSMVKKMPAQTLDIGSKLLSKGKDVWDRSVTDLKDFLKKSKEIISNIIDVMKSFLGKLWDLIKLGTQKVGKFMFTKKLDKLEKIKSSTFSSNDKSNSLLMIDEIQTAGSEYTELIKNYFKRDSFETIEASAEKAISQIKESDIWDSFIGLYSICEKDEIDDLFLIGNDDEDTEHSNHHPKSKVVSWVQAIVQWILSPIGATTEIMAKGFSKAVMSTPSMILKGIQNRTSYKHLPTLVAIITGIIADVAGIKGGIDHISHDATHESVDNKGDAIFNPENFKKMGQSMSKVATSAIAGYALSIAISSCPPLHITFEAIMLIGLVLMFFGWLVDQGIAEDKIPKLCTEFYHWIH